MSKEELPVNTEELYKARIADLEREVDNIRFERVDALVWANQLEQKLKEPLDLRSAERKA